MIVASTPGPLTFDMKLEGLVCALGYYLAIGTLEQCHGERSFSMDTPMLAQSDVFLPP